MARPSNVGCSGVCPSRKSWPHAVEGQTATLLGTPQNFVRYASGVTSRSFTLMPSLPSIACVISAAFGPVPVPATPTSSGRAVPVYLPLGKPAFFMYDAASAGSPVSFWAKSNSLGGVAPPDSSYPGKSGGRKLHAGVPCAVPPRDRIIAWRSKIANTALRTLGLLNGFTVVLRLIARHAAVWVMFVWSLYCVRAFLSRVAGIVKSP